MVREIDKYNFIIKQLYLSVTLQMDVTLTYFWGSSRQENVTLKIKKLLIEGVTISLVPSLLRKIASQAPGITGNFGTRSKGRRIANTGQGSG